MTDPLSVAALSRTAPRVKFRSAQFHIVASQLPCVGRKLRPQQAWVHSVGNRGCIYWPFSGPSEPPCRTAAIDRSCTICAARGRSSVTADKPVRVKERNGTANLFMMFAPLEGWRHVKVTDRHTAVDYARVLKD